ncbi:hypothetical protein T06_10144 [Trichinella sp. T6]|nr:hypothetical protein T06_10144 [Trichinella sp. T6]
MASDVEKTLFAIDRIFLWPMYNSQIMSFCMPIILKVMQKETNEFPTICMFCEKMMKFSTNYFFTRK